MLHARAATTISHCAVLAVILTGSSCYHPNIVDGGLRCAPLPNKRCPDGFFCDVGSDVCRSHPVVGDAMPIDQPSESPADVGQDVGQEVVDAGADLSPDKNEVMCLQPKPGCTAQNPGAACDPYCQSGCGCAEHCVVVDVTGAPTCSQPLPGSLPVGRSCDVASAGTPIQTDACAAGLTCLRDGCGTHCFRYCRGDADCPGSSCSRPVIRNGNPGGYKVCEMPFTTCDPLKTSASGCPLGGQTCYLSPTGADKVFCDCPAGDKRESQPCDSAQDCLPGLACVDASNTGDLRCRAACGIGQADACNDRGTYRPINGSKVYGFCL